MLLRLVISLPHPALHPHPPHHPVSRSPRYPPNSFFGVPGLHSHPDIVSAVSVSSELFVPLCHSFAFSTSLARKASSSLDNRASRSTFPLIEWSLVSSSPRGIFESSIILSSLCGPDTPLLFLILSLASKFPASLSSDLSPRSHQSRTGCLRFSESSFTT